MQANWAEMKGKGRREGANCPTTNYLRSSSLSVTSSPLVWKKKMKKITENSCFHALAFLLRCCLNMSIVCHPLSSSPLSRLTTKPRFDMQVLAPLSLSILDCGSESAPLSGCCNFLATYIIHVCVCVCQRDKNEKVENAADDNHRKRKNMTVITTTAPSQIPLGTNSDLSFTAKAHLSSRQKAKLT